MDARSSRLAASAAPWERALGDSHPRFLARAERARIWDVDGNEYVDWMRAYGPMLLGYGHPAVEAAVAEQLAAGRLPAPSRPAHGRAGRAPGGSDLARAHTGRPRIARVRGSYHAARPWALPHLPGVPTHYRDDLLEFGCLICHSKAIANGHALAAGLAREPLRAAAERIYFTGSFFFASGAFAAALATLDVLTRTDAIARIQRIGGLLAHGLAEQARRHSVPLLPVGQPAMPVIRFAEDPQRLRIRRWCSLVTEGGA